MPDALRESISATEMAGLMGVSPYTTPWLLYQRFANGMNIEQVADSRMNWGTIIEPHIIEQTGKALNLEVQPNRDAEGIQPYVRRGQIGCTRDATIWDPNKGPGALESKCVFDYSVWMQKWDGGKSVPPEIEIQLQCQMYVGDEVTPYKWGIIPVLCCGELKLDFKREPIPELWEEFERRAAQFFEDVAAKRMPDPFGVAVEIPLLKKLYPPVTKKQRDYTLEADAYKIAEDARMMQYHGENKGLHAKAEEAIKDRLKALLLDNEELLLPHGIIVRQKPHGNGLRITVYVPPDLPEGDISFFADTNLGG